MNYNWMPIMGQMSLTKKSLTFKGEKSSSPNEEIEGIEIGLFICDQYFTEGIISTDVKFMGVSTKSCADIVLYYDPQNRYTINAGMTYQNLFAIRHFDNQWINHAVVGSSNSIEKGRTYHIDASLRGSTVTLKVDGVEVLKVTLPFPVPQSQVGLFCVDQTDIEFTNFMVQGVKPKAFVIMQYSSTYNDVYLEVIKNVCNEEEIEVIRIDEESGPGIIIQDMARAIHDSKLVIADITPLNANVFYEVGYAHALKKPTILIAEKETKLPFDVSPFRTLFYENSIGGKRKLEEGLRKHIRASLKQRI